ncbi:MAG: 30S ribosomal protein S17 [Myxococcota bacterium]
MTETQTAPEAAAPEKKRGFRRKLTGTVRSSKMDKTVIVEVVRYYRHRKYAKYVKTRERYAAHDEENYYRAGDRVEIQESRPLSKSKRWVVIRLVAASAERQLEEAKAKAAAESN